MAFLLCDEMALEGIAFVSSLGLILLAATFLNFVARLLNQPPLLAYIAAGILIGPLGLGGLGLEIAGTHIGVNTSEQVAILSELGIAFLLFSVGIETDLRKLMEFGKLAAVGSVVQVMLTALLVFVFNHFLGVLNFEQSVYLGLIVAFSSTTIVVKLLSDSREINTLHGRLMIGFLLVQDILVILTLPLLQNIGAFSVQTVVPLLLNVAFMLVTAYILSRYVYPKIFAFASKSEELLFLSAMSSVFVFIFISFLLGFSMSVGAFIAGVALSTLPYNLEVLHKIRGVRDFLATIFFVTLGIQITPNFASFPIALALVIAGIVFIFKPMIYYAITVLSGYGGRVSLIVALGLAQVSEFSFVIASQGKVILDETPGLYSFIIVIIALSMALTPYFLAYSESVYDLINRILGRSILPLKRSHLLHRKLEKLDAVPHHLSGHVVVFGAGTVGSSIAETLHNHYQVVIVDSDSEVVSYHIGNDIDAVYGSIDNREIWHRVSVEKARLVIIATPFSAGVLSLVRHIKQIAPGVIVFARAHHFKDTLRLYEGGVDYVVMPQVIGSNLFVTKIFEFLEGETLEELLNYKTEFMKYLSEKVLDEQRLKKII